MWRRLVYTRARLAPATSRSIAPNRSNSCSIAYAANIIAALEKKGIMVVAIGGVYSRERTDGSGGIGCEFNPTLSAADMRALLA